MALHQSLLHSNVFLRFALWPSSSLAHWWRPTVTFVPPFFLKKKKKKKKKKKLKREVERNDPNTNTSSFGRKQDWLPHAC
jgi:hypothetical protein